MIQDSSMAIGETTGVNDEITKNREKKVKKLVDGIFERSVMIIKL